MKNLSALLLLALGLFLSGLIDLGSSKPQIVFLDVGQGDAIYIRTPLGQDLLIDAGYGYQVLDQLAQVMPRSDKKIDVLIATHLDADHIGGFKNVLESYQVGEVYFNGEQKDTKQAQAFFGAIEDQGLKPQVLNQGLELSSSGFQMNVLWPDYSDPTAGPLAKEASNNGSIVLSVQILDHKMLLTGDLPKEVEQYLLESHQIVQHDYLQAPHHGSDTSSSLNLAKIVHPDGVYVSVGQDNRYGHPKTEVLDRYQEQGVQIYRTDQSGNLKIELN